MLGLDKYGFEFQGYLTNVVLGFLFFEATKSGLGASAWA